jgi:cell division protein FtsB
MKALVSPQMKRRTEMMSCRAMRILMTFLKVLATWVGG